MKTVKFLLFLPIQNTRVMARYPITLNRRTLFCKSMFNFLVGMNCIDEKNPNVAIIDKRTTDGKRMIKILNSTGVIKQDVVSTTEVTKDDIEKIRELSHRRLAEKIELYGL